MEQPGISTTEEDARQSSTPYPSPSLVPSTSSVTRSRSPRDRVTAGRGVTRTSTTTTTTATRGRATRPSDVGDRLINILQEPQRPYVPEDEKDESYHFALSIVPMLHRIDNKKRQEAKINIINMLQHMASSTQMQPLPPAPARAPTPNPVSQPGLQRGMAPSSHPRHMSSTATASAPWGHS
ncbi:hypothetical protein WMY93_017288 [Mugilogobius chulae]|uniref:BESS domain-containing protein n=1 Tax=Mugilogobius chulae TaxID=88201 RepID=A0AAW0NN96_9GOBI